MACTACLVCLVSTEVAAAKKTSQNCGVCSKHTTKLEQSISLDIHYFVLRKPLQPGLIFGSIAGALQKHSLAYFPVTKKQYKLVFVLDKTFQPCLNLAGKARSLICKY
jgi:hypothetical protein